MTSRLPLLFILALTACGTTDDGGGASGGVGAGAGGEPVPDGCEDEDILDVYSEGLERMGEDGQVKVTLVISTPGAPDKGENRWTLAVHDPNGDAVSDAAVMVRPFMQVHGHPSNPSEFDGDPQGDGTYLVGPFILGMAGRWDFTIDVTLASGTTDTVVFHFCAWG